MKNSALRVMVVALACGLHIAALPAIAQPRPSDPVGDSSVSAVARADVGIGQDPAASALADTIEPGDVVTITPWSGRKMTGRVTSVTACSLQLQTAKSSLPVMLTLVKTVRLHPKRKINPGAKATREFADRCREHSCSHSALAAAGMAALARGFDTLAHPPKVVYRARTRAATPASCTAADPRSPGSSASGPLSERQEI